jgi:hypothetical protein
VIVLTELMNLVQAKREMGIVKSKTCSERKGKERKLPQVKSVVSISILVCVRV